MTPQLIPARMERLTGEKFHSLVESTYTDGVGIGVCVNPNCFHTDYGSQWSDLGWCPRCKTETVASAPLVAAFLK